MIRAASTSLGLAALVACGDTTDAVGRDSAPDVDGGTNGFLASDLWNAAVDHESWTRPAGWTATPTESADHVGLFVVRFDNPTLAAWDGSGSAPEGSISLKEEYDADDVLLSYTAMQKVSGFDAAHGDWFWARYLPDGTVRASGQVALCWGCHADAPQDYLHTDPPNGP